MACHVGQVQLRLHAPEPQSPDRFYVGLTTNLQARLRFHNAGRVSHTSKYLPWQIETALAFRDRTKAVGFEPYLKSESGRAFAKKHL